MRRAFLACTVAAIIGATFNARAADLVVAEPAPIAPTEDRFDPMDWSGFYAGAHLGAAFADWDSVVRQTAVIDCPGPACDPVLTITGDFPGPDQHDESMMGGVQAGFLWQSGRFVAGAEADWSALDIHATNGFAISPAELNAAGLLSSVDPDGFNSIFARELDWLSTVRGRVGLSAGHLLIYATGGLAAAEEELSVGFDSVVAQNGGLAVLPATSHHEDIRYGWTVGGGVEAALTRNWRIKGEYLYVDLGEENRGLGLYLDAPEAPTFLQQGVSVRDQLILHTARIGFNYRFGGAD